MVFSTALSKLLSCLLATAITVQPTFGGACGCGAAKAGSAAKSAQRRSCCSGSSDCHCCCCAKKARNNVDGKSPRLCCQGRPAPNSVPSGVRVCHCASGAPASPQPVPAQRSHSDDFASSALYASAVTLDATALHQDGWAINFPTEFASASDRCISLCRLRF
jgi:hypothetical protein